MENCNETTTNSTILQYGQRKREKPTEAAKALIHANWVFVPDAPWFCWEEVRCCKNRCSVIRVAPDLHCYCRIGKKNPSGRIKGNTLCKLPWPEALALHTPWHPLSFTSCLHASSRAKTEKLDERVCSAPGGIKEKEKEMVLVVAAAMPCVRTTASISADQHNWPAAVELLQHSDFLFLSCLKCLIPIYI